MDAAAYLGVRDRVVSLVKAADLTTVVPSCPNWRVKDVVAHLTGLCEDWVDHRIDRYASEAWTADQVARFSESSLDEVLPRWYAATDRFLRLDDDPIMGSPVRWAFGDAVIHEADIRGSLGAGRVPLEAVFLSLKGSISRWRDVLQQTGAPTLLIRAPDAREWWLGTAHDREATEVEVPLYDLFRALAGRRSRAQVRAWRWAGDPEPFLAAGLPYPFQAAGNDIWD